LASGSVFHHEFFLNSPFLGNGDEEVGKLGGGGAVAGLVRGAGRGGRRRDVAFGRLDELGHGGDDDVEDGCKDEAEDRGPDHGTEDGGAEGGAAGGAGGVGDDEREDAEHEGEGSHGDGAEACAGGLDGGIEDGRAGAAGLACELDDQDGVFGSEPDKEDEPDAGEHVVIEAGEVECEDGPDDDEGDAEDDAEGRGPAFVLSGEDQIDEQDAEGEDDDDLAADLFFLVGHAGPVEADAVGEGFAGEFFHGGMGVAAAAARAGAAVRVEET